MTDFSTLLVNLLTATALAGLIGLEREMRYQRNEQKSNINLGGLRTFAMMGVLGFLGTFLSQHFDSLWILLAIFGATLSFSLVSHTLSAFRQSHFGITSEFSLLASFLVGVLIAINEMLLAVAISVLFTGLLALKSGLHKMAKMIDQEELVAILKFFILSAIILPLLPSSWVDPFGFFDWRPQTVWLMVVLVASIRFVGYFLGKLIGEEKSILLSGIVGGLVSSTAVTTGVAQESKGKKAILIFLIPILVASGIMFVRVLFEVAVVAGGEHDFFTSLLWPLLTMSILSVLLAVYLLFQGKSQKKPVKTNVELKQPLQMKSALAFGAFFLLVLLISEKISLFFSDSGLLVTGAISGLTDVDAITLAMANLVRNGEVDTLLASQVVLIAVAVNTLVKVGIVFLFGSRELFKWAFVSIVGILIVGGGVLFL